MTMQLGRQGRGGEASTSSRVGGTGLPGAALCKHAVPQAAGVLGGCDRLLEPLGRLAGQHRGPDQGGSSGSGTARKSDQRRFSPDSQPRRHTWQTWSPAYTGPPSRTGVALQAAAAGLTPAAALCLAQSEVRSRARVARLATFLTLDRGICVTFLLRCVCPPL